MCDPLRLNNELGLDSLRGKESFYMTVHFLVMDDQTHKDLCGPSLPTEPAKRMLRVGLQTATFSMVVQSGLKWSSESLVKPLKIHKLVGYRSWFRYGIPSFSNLI